MRVEPRKEDLLVVSTVAMAEIPHIGWTESFRVTLLEGDIYEVAGLAGFDGYIRDQYDTREEALLVFQGWVQDSLERIA